VLHGKRGCEEVDVAPGLAVTDERVEACKSAAAQGIEHGADYLAQLCSSEGRAVDVAAGPGFDLHHATLRFVPLHHELF
jgi:hypothetical protein